MPDSKRPRGGACLRRPDCRATLTKALADEIEQIVEAMLPASEAGTVGRVPDGTLAGDAFAEFQRAELAKWGKAVRDSGAKD